MVGWLTFVVTGGVLGWLAPHPLNSNTIIEKITDIFINFPIYELASNTRSSYKAQQPTHIISQDKYPHADEQQAANHIYPGGEAADIL
jgi:hypothetical protein